MKTPAVIVLLVIALVGFSSGAPKFEVTPEQRKAFDEWKQTHKKEYRTIAEELIALEIVLINLAKIIEHNKLYDQGKVTYTRGLYKYSDLSKEDRKKFLKGHKRSDRPKNSESTRSKRTDQKEEHEHEHHHHHHHHDENRTYPAEYDIVNWKNQGWVSPVEDQGERKLIFSFSTWTKI